MVRPRPTYVRVNPVFPEDFPERLERLERLKEASGLSWHQIALALGTTPSVIREWRSGNKRPSPVYMYALFMFADTVPDGRDILLHGRASPPDPDRPSEVV